jgi:hypothetical protein
MMNDGTFFTSGTQTSDPPANSHNHDVTIGPARFHQAFPAKNLPVEMNVVAGVAHHVGSINLTIMAPSLSIPHSPTRSATMVPRSLKRQTAALVTPPLPAEKKPRKACSAKKSAVVTVASVAAAAATTSSSPFPSVTAAAAAAAAAFSSVPSTNTPRTESFHALVDPRVPVHTLILGTHPSVKSLEEQEYYGHAMNAFWWIAGDCLGFRRAA